MVAMLMSNGMTRAIKVKNVIDNKPLKNAIFSDYDKNMREMKEEVQRTYIRAGASADEASQDGSTSSVNRHGLDTRDPHKYIKKYDKN